MFKNKYVLEVLGKEDRVYRLDFDPKAPLGELHDALFTMKGAVVKMIMERQEQEKAPENKEEDCCEKPCSA